MIGSFVGSVRSRVEDRVHLVVRSRSDAEGFVLVGGHRPRHHFSRVYLGSRDHRLRFGLHRPAEISGWWKRLRDHGLIVFCGATTPQELDSEALHTSLMVELVMAVPSVLEGPHASWSGSVRADIKKLRDRFSCEVQGGDAWVDEFARRFHTPSMSQRHGTEAYATSANALRDRARTQGAEFLRITRDGVWVGGAINRSMPEGYRLQCLGWRGGEPQLLRDGVVAAIYWFGIRRASELGHSRVMLGHVAPYLEDGLLFFKGKWGGHVDPARRSVGDIHLLLDPSHRVCRHFLASHSLLARGSDGGVIVFSARRPAEVNAPRTILASVRRWYRWREQPDVDGATTQTEVPPRLRPWLVEEELPRAYGDDSHAH